MCSFLVTSKDEDLTRCNVFQQKRGPDYTNVIKHGSVTMLHNLLSITGALTPQPFIEGEIGAVFNGEIYNYKDFGTYNSDGEVLIPLYKKYGARFVEHLDGEFAITIVDHATHTVVLSTDIFGTKPLWYAFQENSFGVASYKSALARLGFSQIERLPPNTVRVYSLKDHSLQEEKNLYAFDLKQHKSTYEDFFAAYEAAIAKRSKGVTKKIFLGLSSGYDSGAIACALEKQKVDFCPYSIIDGEHMEVLEARFARHKNSVRFSLSSNEFLTAKDYIKRYAEDMYMNILPELGRGDYVSNNTGAIGLGAICKRARDDGYRVLFSGQGADEILSDYGFNGKKLTKHSSFGGLFPADLHTVFPWRNFFGGVQRAYLDKEEVVAGAYGIETRYPFLDRDVVQEFLWLTPELKNAQYKAPLAKYLEREKYPFESEAKRGFTPAAPSRWIKMSLRSLRLHAFWFLLRVYRQRFG